MNILLPGPYPRSEKLVAVSRDFDRERATLQELKDTWQSEMQALRTLQVGFPYFSPGLFQWQDLLRPFSELIPGAEATGLQRFFETNTFWRKFEFKEEPEIDHEKLEAWINKYFFGEGAFDKEDNMLFTLPFLFLFKDFSHGADISQIAAILEIVGTKLLSSPNKALCFYDPTFGWRKHSEEEKQLGYNVLHAIKKHTSSPIYLWTSFFPINTVTDYLFALPVDGFGVDFYANSVQDILKDFPQNKTLLAGIINTESTLIEPKASVEEFIKTVLTYLPEEQLIFTPNGPAELLPKEVMDKKVINLQELITWQPNSSLHTK